MLTDHGARLLARLDGLDEWTEEWGRVIGVRGADRTREPR